jgi:hypothetical protein
MLCHRTLLFGIDIVTYRINVNLKGKWNQGASENSVTVKLGVTMRQNKEVKRKPKEPSEEEEILDVRKSIARRLVPSGY